MGAAMQAELFPVGALTCTSFQHRYYRRTAPDCQRVPFFLERMLFFRAYDGRVRASLRRNLVGCALQVFEGLDNSMSFSCFKLSAVLASVVVASCATGPVHDANGLQGSEWRVTEIAGQAAIAGSQASLGFGADGRLYGNASCNRLVGTYRVEGSHVTLSNAGLTMMACSQAEMDQERRLVDVLNQVNAYEIAANGALALSTPAGTRIVAQRGNVQP